MKAPLTPCATRRCTSFAAAARRWTHPLSAPFCELCRHSVRRLVRRRGLALDVAARMVAMSNRGAR